MKILLILLLLLVSIVFISPSIHAQRLECDDCGYCIGREAPGNWDSCRKCLYDKTTGEASSNETLRATKTPGNYYTQLGCLNVGASSFTDPSAPGGVLNFLLSRLIFPIVGTLSFLSLIYGAFLLMTAQGSSEQIGKGKSYVVGAIVGLIFTLSAILIINIIAGDILRIPGFSRSPELRIFAYSTSAKDSNGVVSYPEMKVYINDQLIDALLVDNSRSNIKEFKYPTSIVATTMVKVEFPNDFDPPNTDEINGSWGDRNLFVNNILYGEKECVPNIYFKKNSNSSAGYSYPAKMWYTGYITCTISP